MSLIEIPLNSYRYHFRNLSWREESALRFAPNEDQRRTYLAQALVDISGMPVTPAQAKQVLQSLPEAVLWRIWIVYRASGPEQRYYTSGGLYEAPDTVTYSKRINAENEAAEATADAASAHLESRYGKAGLDEAENISRQMFQNAKRQGSLIPFSGASLG